MPCLNGLKTLENVKKKPVNRQTKNREIYWIVKFQTIFILIWDPFSRKLQRDIINFLENMIGLHHL